MQFAGKTLLITGGTGTFGTSLLQKLLKTNIQQIRIFSRDQAKQSNMVNYYKDNRIKYYIGDIRDFHSIDIACRGVDYIFHAAALKQVPTCQLFPIQATKTNILGADNTISSAIKNNVKKIILLSTDKAVYPISAMGLSKSMMEKIAISYSRMSNISTIIACTRFGNIIGSRCSVIPLFIQKIKAGLDIDVTCPQMTRYIMSVSQAIDLVLFALEFSKQGDIFIQKADSIRLIDLATALIQLFQTKTQINIVGRRIGEKMNQLLISPEQMNSVIDMGTYLKIQTNFKNLDYAGFNTLFKQNQYIQYTSEKNKILSIQQIKNLLLKDEYINKLVLNTQ